MCKKLVYVAFFVLVLGVTSGINAESFSLIPVFDGHVSNDGTEGPDVSPGGSGMHIRDVGGRRRVGFVAYDISGLKSQGDVFSNVSFSNYGHDAGEVNVYGVLEEYEDLVAEAMTWNTAPGVQNDPTPANDTAVVLDLADVTDILLTFNAPARGTRQSTETSQALADFLSSDTNGFVAFMFAPAEGGNAIVRTVELGEDGGTRLEGDIGGFLETARNPEPADGAYITGTWITLGWKPGDFAVSHDIYLGESFDEVDEGTEGTFVGNQIETFIVLGFPGFPYPDGLVPGTTYYWRIDEVNEAEPNSPWKGPVWSFTVPPKTAYLPEPADGAESVGMGAQLSWTMGYGAKLHTVYFGDNFEDVNNATVGHAQGLTTYNPGTLKMARTYYWRIDENDGIETYKGDVWSFIVEGAVSSPEPASGADGITQTPALTWVPGVFGASHEIFFGTDKDAVKHANTSSPEYKGSGNLGSESFEPGRLEWNTTYYWRVDEANNTNSDSPWIGPVWSFTTANFLIIDDMESYNDLDPTDPQTNRIFNAWIDGFEDPTNGSLVGYETPPFTEQVIVHSGNQSMPFAYDNSVGNSEATLTLTANRDWTINGVDTLTIWFRGSVGNAAENLYVALNGNAVVNHDNPEAALRLVWTQWNIDLQAFADQGVNLTNVNSITLGLSSVTGGTGTMYFDDIRLYATD
ncbi:MAG: hypothetical protein JW837_17095 [Sedimentisphaerales bacterium]|nr:hypothetical protein [Sedimentisphaerales bacterium]